MGTKNRRARLRKGVDHVLTSVAPRMASELGYDPEWLRDQLLAAIRVIREVDRSLNLYEENFREDLLNVLRAVRDEDRNEERV